MFTEFKGVFTDQVHSLGAKSMLSGASYNQGNCLGAKIL